MKRLAIIEREGLRTDLPDFGPGDTVRVQVRVREGEKERLQAFEGVCIGRRGGGISETFTQIGTARFPRSDCKTPRPRAQAD